MAPFLNGRSDSGHASLSAVQTIKHQTLLFTELNVHNPYCRDPEVSRQRTELESRSSRVRSPTRPVFFPRIDDSHCDRIHSPLTAVYCFDNGYVGKQPVAWKEYSAQYWFKELQESIDRCTGRRDIAEILLKTALNNLTLIMSNLN